jgi:hypothetical protein
MRRLLTGFSATMLFAGAPAPLPLAGATECLRVERYNG